MEQGLFALGIILNNSPAYLIRATLKVTGAGAVFAKPVLALFCVDPAASMRSSLSRKSSLHVS
jgi:hypothetical protein